MSYVKTNYPNGIVTLKRGEIKLFTFTFNVVLTGASFQLKARKDDPSATGYALEINDASFDKTDIANKKVKCVIDTTSLLDDTRYILELMTTFGVQSVDKTDTIILEIEKPVIS